MRSIFFLALFLVVFVFSSCISEGKHTGTHTHADGTVHHGHHHDDDSVKGSAQESFKVESDSIGSDTIISKEEADINKAKGHTHDHGDGKSHSH
jgi:hypothetical protein